MKQIIFGHRGIPSLAPENSLKSFKLILNHKIPGVELDIHLTKDKKLVVIHDFNTQRMTGYNYEVSETEYSILEQLNLGEDQKIPLLEEVFTLLGKKVLYDLEIKSQRKNRKTIVAEVLKLIDKFNFREYVMVSSFDPLILKEFNRLKSGIDTGIIYMNKKNIPFIARFGFGLFITKCTVIKPNFEQLKGFLYFFYRKILKKKCYTWTINTKEDMEYAYKRGCKGICSNVPQKLKS